MERKNYYKLISYLLVLVLCLGSIPVAYAKTDIWDGYVEEDANVTKKVDLINLNSSNTLISQGLTPSSEHTRSGKRYSVHWDDHVTNSNLLIYMREELQNWTDYDTLNVWLYSEKATKADFMILLMCPQVNGVNSYFYNKTSFNWTGWKRFSFKLDELGYSGSPDFATVSTFRLCAGGGWNLVPNAETDIYIGEITLEKTNEFDFVTGFYDQEDIDLTYKALENAAAVYGGGSNVVTGQGAKDADYICGYKENAVTVPLKFFAENFGVTVKSEQKNFSLQSGNVKVLGTVDSSYVTVGEKQVKLSMSPYMQDGNVYVPGKTVAELLGLFAIQDEKLLVVGKDSSVEIFLRKESLGVNEYGEIASYLAYHDEIVPSMFRAEDCEAVMDNWTESIVGNEETNDISDADIQKRINTITTSGQSSWNSLIKSEAADELFTSITSVTSGDVNSAYARVYNMACAYSCYGGDLYKNEDLLADIIYALDWLTENRYNAGTYSGTSPIWTVTGTDNWWYWAIGIPQQLIPTLMLIREDLSQAQIKNYLAFFDMHVPAPRMTGANFTDMAQLVIGSALLKNDAETVAKTQTSLYKSFLYVDDNVRFAESLLDSTRSAFTETKGAGFFTDGSYILHTLHPHLGSYGIVQFETWSNFLQLFAGTNFMMKIPFTENVAKIYETSYKPAIYDGKMFRWTMGRGPGNNTVTVSPFVCMFRTAEAFDSNVQKTVEADLKALGQQYYQNVVDALPMSHIKAFKELMENDSITASSEALLNQVYYNNDKVVHSRADWGASVSMSSSRIFNYESILNNNMDGWYLSDGRTEYYLKGSDVNATGAYYSAIDKYRLPGTTVDTQERVKASINQGQEYLSSKSFVGGATLGTYGVAAMDLESYHTGGTYPATGTVPAHQSDLTAKKSYFMFDDEIVCLGTEVNAKNNNDAEVLTIVDNVLSKTQVSLSEETLVEPYAISSAVANQTPEAENVAENTIDNSFETKYAGDSGAELVWDLGEIKQLGFIDLSFMKGSTRQQYFKLAVSEDGTAYREVFSGASSGKTEEHEYFDLGGANARYVKFINLGNSGGSSWVSLTHCDIYPPNADGSIGLVQPEIYGADNIIADGVKREIYGEETDFDNVYWANVAGQCGYVFPKEQTENRGSLKARWTKGNSSCFEIWFSHGVNPTNGGYSYILLPGMSAEETGQYAQNSSIQILANDKTVQAVRDSALGVTGIVFWEAGSFAGITVDEPCMVVYHEKDGSYEIAVSEPTRKLDSVQVSVNKTLTATDIDDCARVSVAEGQTVINYDVTETVGRSMKVSLKSGGTVSSDGGNAGGGTSSGGSSGGGADSTKTEEPKNDVTEDTPTVTVAEKYTDIQEATWAQDYLLELSERGILSGYGDNTLRPNQTVTREEFLKMVLVALEVEVSEGEAGFSDVVEGAWYSPYVATAMEKGILQGRGDGSFGVGVSIAREDMAVIVCRVMQHVGISLREQDTSFTDQNNVSAYAISSIRALAAANIINGRGDGSICPKDFATRAEAAKILCGILELFENKGV